MSDDEFRAAIRAVFGIRDCLSVGEWRRLVEEEMADQSLLERPAGMSAEEREYGARFEEEYLNWKETVGRHAVLSGSIFGCAFWIDYVDRVGPQLSAFGLEGYARLCIRTFAGQLVSRMCQRSLTQAERLNDQGFELHHAGCYEDALTLHNQALELAPDFPLAYVNKGIALKNLGRFDEAIEVYDHVIEAVDPECKKAWANKGSAYFAQGDFARALPCYDRAIEIDPTYDFAEGMRQRARDALAAGPRDHPGAGEEHWETFAQEHPELVDRTTLILRFANDRNFEAAARVADSLIEPSGRNPAVVAAAASMWGEAGDLAACERLAREALELDPNLLGAWIDLSRCRLESHDSAGVAEACERAIAIDASASMAWANRAGGYALDGEFGRCERAAREAVRLDHYNEVGRYYLVIALSSLGKPEDALVECETLARLFPSSKFTRHARATLQ